MSEKNETFFLYVCSFNSHILRQSANVLKAPNCQLQFNFEGIKLLVKRALFSLQTFQNGQAVISIPS